MIPSQMVKNQQMFRPMGNNNDNNFVSSSINNRMSMQIGKQQSHT